MAGEFWKSVSGKLADRWAGLGTAVVFWAGLIVVWLWAHDGWDTAQAAANWLQTQSDIRLVGLLLGGLTIATAPVIVVTRITSPMLRLLEGYWPKRARKLWDRLVAVQKKRLVADQNAFQLLAAAHRAENKATSSDVMNEYVRLDLSLHHWPAAPERLMPTRVGNVLRAAEDRPRHKYGLDSVIIWPRLWLLLPDTVRQELTTARGTLDSGVATVIWGLLFAVAAPITIIPSPATHWLPILVGIGVGIATAIATWAWWVPRSAMVFADLLDATFDLYRFTVYEQIRWPLPSCPANEPHVGEQVTKYLWRGSRSNQPTFNTPDEKQ